MSRERCAACGRPQGTGNLGQPRRIYTLPGQPAICDACAEHIRLGDCDCEECEELRGAVRQERLEQWVEKAKARAKADGK